MLMLSVGLAGTASKNYGLSGEKNHEIYQQFQIEIAGGRVRNSSRVTGMPRVIDALTP